MSAPASGQDNAGGVHRIDAPLTIYSVAEQHKALVALLGRAPGSPLRIDLSGISECDCAGIQLLFSLKRTAAETGRRLEFIAPSKAVSDTAAETEIALF